MGTQTVERVAQPTADVAHLSRAERATRGKQARKTTPLESHREFEPAKSRDPVKLLLGQSATRDAELVPIRHGRMLVSPFTFYRGAALPMVADLATTPVSGLRAQLCGDAHLANFGAYASPDRRLVFDVNDFDETLPGPFEWDVKRLAASFAVAGRSNGLAAADRRRILLKVASTYRTAIRAFAEQSIMDVWYARLDVDEAVARYRSRIPAKRREIIERLLAQARTRDSKQAMRKLTTTVDGRTQIISDPPVVVPVEELFANDSKAVYALLRTVVTRYGRTLQSDRRLLLEQFRLVQVARKIVGVGSVGQRAWMVLMEGTEGDDPLVLQAKEAQPSILADYVGRSRFSHQGERVVAGQHLMQAASDIFLGWTHNKGGADGVDRDFYVRQLRDWKLSFPIDQMKLEGLTVYAELCGWTLARGHARSGDRVGIAAYLGRSDKFDQAVADFAEAYADQNERDYATFQAAHRAGRVPAIMGV